MTGSRASTTSPSPTPTGRATAWRAFDISEESRARSLLDSRNNSPRAATSDATAGAAFTSVTRPLALAELQARIPADVQVVQYAALDDKLLIWVVTKDDFDLVKSDIGAADLQAKVMSYTRAVARGPGAGAAELGRELYGLVVGPAAGLLDPRKVVCVVPDKALSYLPFPALISPRSGNYLVADFTVMSSPSLNVFLLCSEASRGKADKAAETILSVGNPAFDRAAHPTLADLAGAAREARNIAREHYSAAYEFIGPDALKEPIRAKLPEADVIHFACHYVADERYPAASRLVLAKGGGAGGGDDLTAGELAAQQLPRAKLVVLSACQTGGESYYNGEGMVGISRTFLAAGVPVVVASQWAVDFGSDRRADAEVPPLPQARRLPDRLGAAPCAARPVGRPARTLPRPVLLGGLHHRRRARRLLATIPTDRKR